jgi:cardiolipin synthase
MAMVWATLLWVNYGLAIVVALGLLLRRKEPTTMTAWLLAILLVPFGGLIAYWFLGSGRLSRKVGRRRRRVAFLLTRLRDWANRHALGGSSAARAVVPPELADLEQIARRLAEMPAVGGNEVSVICDAAVSFAALEAALRGAQHSIHLEYYAWSDDETGRRFRDLIADRARAGVQVRLLLDAGGCFTLSRRFIRPLIDAGVKVAYFLPLHRFPFSKRWSLHLRNHRKIVIVDGQDAFMGSQNIGDEYVGRVPSLSPWIDAQLHVRGPAALCLQEVFAEDWYLAAKERLDQAEYFPEPLRAGGSVVQILPTGPDQSLAILEQIVFGAVSAARRSIRIATPYFVPEAPLRMALLHAACRGLEVKLVLPTRSDVPLAVWAARSFYAELLDGGVEIFEFDGGMLHAKLIAVDEQWCLLGSANMDARSFRLNYEVGAAIFDAPVVRGVAAMIDAFCAQGRPITARRAHHVSLLRRMGEGAARLFAPLL